MPEFLAKLRSAISGDDDTDGDITFWSTMAAGVKSPGLSELKVS